ncbi:MAG: hypothetical protein A2096_04030 [Spirochaetes bacterium GWF1_41_5]|nr:MAG: hypothetical protein A2096_04030 [Spirochaetes bacterium GWF1_41_5]
MKNSIIRKIINNESAKHLNSGLLSQIDGGKNIWLFFGPGGSGKKTVIVKLAAFLLKQRGNNVFFGSLDTAGLGSPEKLQIFARILKCDFSLFFSISELRAYLLKKKNRKKYSAFLINMSNKKIDSPAAEINQLCRLTGAGIIQVLPLTHSRQVIENYLRKNYDIKHNGIILTKADENPDHYQLKNLLKKHKLFALSCNPELPGTFYMI